MSKRTSVYLSDDLAAAVEQAGLPLAELIRRGIYGPPANPVAVPIRPEVPRPTAAVVVPPADGGDARAAEVPQAAPAGDAGDTAGRWVCDFCGALMVRPGTERCEQCAWPRSHGGAA